MRTQKLVYRIENILQDKEMTCKEIMAELEREMPSNRTNSFTSNQIGQLLRNKRFEKIGWCKIHDTNIWRNKYVMDRKIQTK
tara:strand:- start:152 stop:397 length:246 start_codon:yes stop_codon:yes gene_type:complete